MRQRTKVHNSLQVIKPLQSLMPDENSFQLLNQDGNQPIIAVNTQILSRDIGMSSRPDDIVQGEKLLLPSGKQISSDSKSQLQRFIGQESQAEPEQEPIQKSTFTEKSKNMFSALIVLGYARKFIKNLRKTKEYSQITLNHHQLALVNDAAADDPENIGSIDYLTMLQVKVNHIKRKKSIVHECIAKVNLWMRNCMKASQMQRVLIILNLIPVFSPESKPKQIWDIFLFLLKLYQILLIPLELACNNGLIFGSAINPITTLSSFIMLLDLVLYMNTGYYKFGQLIMKRKKPNYTAALDGLAIIVLLINSILSYKQSYSQESSSFKFLTITMFTHFKFLVYLKSRIEAKLNLTQQQNSIYRVIKLVVTMLFVEHMAACVWIIVGQYGFKQGYPNSWIQEYDMHDKPWYEIYMQALYFVVVTMVSVGYGDVAPQSYLSLQIIDYMEKAFAIVFMVYSSIQLSYVLSTCGAIIQQLNRMSENTKRKIKIINAYMKRKHIKESIQQQQIQKTYHRIREYLQYYWQQEGESEIKEESMIISQLSVKLQEKLTIDSNTSLLSNINLFKKQFTAPMIASLAKVMKSEIAYPEEVVDLKKFKCHNGPILVFIESGVVDEYIEGDGQQTKVTIVKTHHQGVCIGLLEFFNTNLLKSNFKSRGFTRLSVLSKTDFLDLLQEFPQDKETYWMITNEMQIEQKHKSIKQSCHSCYQTEHVTSNCPYIHYQPDKEFIIKQYCYNTEQGRKVHCRNQDKQYNSLIDQQMIQEVGELWRLNNPQNQEAYQIEDDEHYEGPQNYLTPTLKDAIKSPSVPVQIRNFSFNSSRRSLLEPQKQFHGPIQDSTKESVNIQNKEINPYPQRVKGTLGAKVQQLALPSIAQNDVSNYKEGQQANVENMLLNVETPMVNSQLDNPHYWYNRLQKMQHVEERVYDFKCQEEILLALKRLSTLIGEENVNLDPQFEAMHEFRTYMPQNNFSRISFDLNLQADFRLLPQWQSKIATIWVLTKYMFYPNEFVMKYRQKKLMGKIIVDDEFALGFSSKVRRRRSRRVTKAITEQNSMVYNSI